MFLFPVILKMPKIDANIFILSFFEIWNFMLRLLCKIQDPNIFSILSNLIKTINSYLPSSRHLIMSMCQMYIYPNTSAQIFLLKNQFCDKTTLLVECRYCQFISCSANDTLTSQAYQFPSHRVLMVFLE